MDDRRGDTITSSPAPISRTPSPTPDNGSTRLGPVRASCSTAAGTGRPAGVAAGERAGRAVAFAGDLAGGPEGPPPAPGTDGAAVLGGDTTRGAGPEAGPGAGPGTAASVVGVGRS